MWVQGTLKVEDQAISYSIKVFEEPSEYGINQGRISKLTLENNNKVIANYEGDRKEMGKETLQRLEREVKACKHYTANAIRKADDGKVGAAINMLDIAQTAKTCAMQAHDELWKVSGGKLSSKEFELFADAETLSQKIRKAYQVIKQARN